MDPLSQGVAGAILAQSSASRKNVRAATLIGMVSGMMADLDILIRSPEDPLLNIEYHRHFTHALLFVPIGALIAALLFYPLMRRRLSFAQIYGFAFLGYGTAGLIDACTSYGTQLLWPLSDARIAWDIISIIDPIFTLPLLILALLAFWKRRPRIGQIACIFALCYLTLGVIQRERALGVAYELAVSRGHPFERITVKPSIFNLLVWRSIYERGDRFYVDAIRVGLKNKVYPGGSVEAYDWERALDELPEQSRLAHDITRFAHFSDNYLSRVPNEDNVIGDTRYATLPNSIEPLWGIRITPEQPEQAVSFEHFRTVNPERIERFKTMLRGEPLPE